MRDVDAQAVPTKESSNPLSSEAVKLAFSQPGALKDVQVFTSGEHTVTSGKVIARGNAIVHAISDDVTVFALDHAVVDAHKNATVAAYGHAHVQSDNANIFAHEKSVVEAHGWGTVRAYDRASINATDTVTVSDVHLKGKSDRHNMTLGAKTKFQDVLLFDKGENWIHSGEGETHGNSTIVHADGDAQTTAYDQSTTILSGKAVGEGWDHARLVSTDHSTAYAFAHSSLNAYDFTENHGHDGPTIYAHGNAWVAANDSSTIFAYDAAQIHARDSMAHFGGHIDAYGNSTVIRDRYEAGPPGAIYTLHDQSQFQDTDMNGKVISTVHAGDQK